MITEMILVNKLTRSDGPAAENNKHP
jgi:hypothetical protein